jgi:hypothetical protein
MSRGLGHIARLGRYLKGKAVATKLRTFLASWPWYRWLFFGSGIILMALGLLPVTASWPWPVRIVAYGLGGIALLVFFVAMVIISAEMVAVLLTGILPETAGRTDKAKEKLADSFMSVGNTIHSATLVAILVVPLTVFLQTTVCGKDPAALLPAYLHTVGTDGTARWYGFLLGVLIFVPIVAAFYIKGRALQLYDEISKRAELPPQH